MSSFKDLTGKTFERWTVVKRAPSRIMAGKPHTYWHCRCLCGRTGEILRAALVRGGTKSCGCLAVELTKIRNRREGTAFRNLLRTYIAGANARGISFNLSETQFRQLVLGNCFYCAAVPSMVSLTRIGETFIHNGVDRLNPEIGYVMENCVSSCSPCNYMKQDYSQIEFIAKCKEIARVHAQD